jgi:hypothetical protein
MLIFSRIGHAWQAARTVFVTDGTQAREVTSR